VDTRSPVVDLTDVDVFVDGGHHASFVWLREHEPVYRNPLPDGGKPLPDGGKPLPDGGKPLPDGGGFWALTRYDDVVAAYSDHTAFSSLGGAVLGGSFRSDADTASGRMLVASDPPRHRMLRKVMHQVFTPAVVDRVGAVVTRLVDEAVRRMLADGGCDFATDIAPRLPAGALMGMLGLTYDEACHLIGLTRRMIGYRDSVLVDTAGDERLRLAESQADIFEFFADLLRDRGSTRGDDLLSVLTGASLNGRPLTEDEILYNCMNVAVGGNETSSYTACAGLLALTEHPEQARLLAGRPELLDTAVNEMLRWASTNAYVQRIATRDVELGGRTIRAGDVVTLWNVSANRDEDQFPNAHRFDVTRTPNRHLSYGVGIHRCIGATLAHTELTTLFRRLHTEKVGFAVAGRVSRLRSNFILGITSLPLRVTGER
jgi:cytochrome P450